jgi:hypothetical protein
MLHLRNTLVLYHTYLFTVKKDTSRLKKALKNVLGALFLAS